MPNAVFLQLLVAVVYKIQWYWFFYSEQLLRTTGLVEMCDCVDESVMFIVESFRIRQ